MMKLVVVSPCAWRHGGFEIARHLAKCLSSTTVARLRHLTQRIPSLRRGRQHEAKLRQTTPEALNGGRHSTSPASALALLDAGARHPAQMTVTIATLYIYLAIDSSLEPIPATCCLWQVNTYRTVEGPETLGSTSGFLVTTRLHQC